MRTIRSIECEGLAEEEYLYGYPGADEMAIIAMVQRYGPGPILRHLAGG